MSSNRRAGWNENNPFDPVRVGYTESAPRALIVGQPWQGRFWRWCNTERSCLTAGLFGLRDAPLRCWFSAPHSQVGHSSR